MAEIQRKCQGCQKIINRDELIKITRLSDGTIKINPKSTELGRSVYVCKNPECIKIFIKKKKLIVALKSNNQDEIKKIEEYLTNNFL